MFAKYAAAAAAFLPRDRTGNLELIFKIGNGQWVADAFGNEIEQTSEFRIFARVHAHRVSRIDETIGADSNILMIRGRCVQPSVLPNSITPGTRGTAMLIDESRGLHLTGEFTLDVHAPTPYAALDRKLGSFIEGSIRVQGGS